MLTPSDIEQKTFHTSLRGYDLDEVDDFLDEIVATIRDLTEKLDSAPSPAGNGTPAGDESAVGRALVAAQTAADQMIADAKAEAEKILEEAKAEAENWAAERDEKKAAAAEEMVELSQHVAGVRTQLALLATAVADRLDEMDEALNSESGEPQGATDDDEAASNDGFGEADSMADADDDDGEEVFHHEEEMSSSESGDDEGEDDREEEQGDEAGADEGWN